MYMLNKKIISMFLIFFFVISTGFANPSVEFIASNNTKEINLQTAYERLTGKNQLELQNSMIDVMQENHVEQGRFEGILGTYQMASDQNITADNSDRFSTSPKQNLSNKKIFSLAKELAVKLNQESIAVFIPNKTLIGKITVRFISSQPAINEIVNIIHEKLPPFYSQAFSMQLENKFSAFDNQKVTEIEWLGNKIHLEDIQSAFPHEKINYEYGDTFLVFQNGQKEAI